jgi:hypothetical protein
MGIAVSDLLESYRRQRSSHSVMSRRADELFDEQLMARLSGPEVEAAISTLYDRLQSHRIRSGP